MKVQCPTISMITNRSKVVSYFQCPRYRYLKYHYNGNGISRTTSTGAQDLGTSIHKGVALLLEGKMGKEEVVKLLLEEYRASVPPSIPHYNIVLWEHLTFLEGILRVFARCRIPQLNALGATLAVEQEKTFALNNDITFQFRADAIIQCEDGIVVVDVKPTAYGGFQFVRGWERNHQVLSYVKAAETIYDLNVLGVRIEGYLKGKRMYDAKLFGGQVKIQNSPLCYVYVNNVSGQIAPDYQRGSEWAKMPLWETSLTPKEYIEELLTVEQCEKLFLAPIPPIAPNRERLKRWERQTVANELRIEKAARLVERVRVGCSEETFLRVLDEQFPQNHDSCYKYGEDYPCEMDQVCFNGQVESDPLASGLYEERREHHEDGVE